jgi:hypothetical protein
LIIQFAFPVDIDLVSVYGSCILSPINVCHIICTCRVVSSYLQFTVIWDVSTCLVYNCIEWLACSPEQSTDRMQGRIRGGAHAAPPPPKIGKNMILLA